MPNFKKRTYRSKAYLDWIRTLSCLVCGEKPVEAHHVETGGVGMKCTDLYTAPLCNLHHRELHDTGKQTFYDGYHIDIYRTIPRLLAMYIEQREGNL